MCLVCSYLTGAFPIMSTLPNPATNLEALLRDACRRALGLGLSFTNQLRLYRSILALAREVRLRLGGGMFDAGSQTVAALLAAVSERASELGLEPELPLPDAILLQRLAVRLSRAARLAGAEPMIRAQQPLHREEPMQHQADGPTEPAGQTLPSQHAGHREEPAQHGAPGVTEPTEPAFRAQQPLHRETDAADDGLSPWRNDHKTDRDQRAHELLRTVIDERSIAKVKAMNRRDREEQARAA
jgi:hypothetical protein